MLTNKFQPLYAADAETGSAEPEAGGTPPTTPEEPSGPGSGRSQLRQQLEKNFEADRKRDTERDEGRRPDGTFKKGHQVGERRRAAAPEGEPETAPSEPAEGEPTQETPEVEATGETETETPTEPETKAPEGWSKEAKAEWAKLPEPVQKAVSKREADMAKGVEELKSKYSDIDRVLAPNLDSIRQHGHTPAQAIDQLFGWMRALAVNPDVAFPALAQSFRYDLKKLLQPEQTAEPAKEPPKEAQPEIPANLQPYFAAMQGRLQELETNLQQQLGGFQQTFQQQQQQKTEEILKTWSKDKPYFEEVRGEMARLIGGGVVPLKDGNVDLDGAYERAIYGLPEIRNKILADQQKKAEDERRAKAAAEKKAQQEQAEKARKAAVGLGQGAPGTSSGAKGVPKKGKSIRESLMDSIEELNS